MIFGWTVSSWGRTPTLTLLQRGSGNGVSSALMMRITPVAQVRRIPLMPPLLSWEKRLQSDLAAKASRVQATSGRRCATDHLKDPFQKHVFNVLNQSRGAALVMFLFTVLTNKVEGRLQLDLEVAQFCFDRNDGSIASKYIAQLGLQ